MKLAMSSACRRPRPLAAAVLMIALAFPMVGRPSPAVAHAIIVESVPAANQAVAGPDLEVRLRYNSRIDKQRSRLSLTLPDKGTQPVAILEEGEENILSARLTGLAAGAYSLHWQVLSVDGHITRGDIPFRVGAP